MLLPHCPLLLSSCHLSSTPPFACSGRNGPSIVFILSGNGPHIMGHREAICPYNDGCILRFLQLQFWQTDIWAHLKPGGITFIEVCNPGKGICSSCCSHTHSAFSSVCHAHITPNEQQKHNWSECHNLQSVFVLISCREINTADRNSLEHKSWINSIFHSI